jgi:hypothetical protein
MEEKKFNYFNAADKLEGFEDINASTMAIPFIRILQTKSPQLDKRAPEYIEGAEEGQFFNNVTKKIYGEKINLIILKFEHIYIEWLPARGGFVGVHSPENAAKITISKEFNNWQTEDGNILQENYCYFCLVEGEEEQGPVIMTMCSTALKTAKNLNRLITSHVMPNGNRALPYWLVIEFSSLYKTNDKDSWYIPTATIAGYINEEQYNVTKQERLALPDRKVDYAQLEGGKSSDDDGEEITGEKEKIESKKSYGKVPY